MALSPEDRLGVYEIRELLGAGGMGEVYRAWDERLQRDVAVKVLPAELMRDEEALARFEREARAVAALSHPNVLQIFDFGRDGNRVWAVTELLEGETLRERLDRGRLEAREALTLANQMLAGVAAAHAKGIVHRDLKPENVFVTRAGETSEPYVKILDFGLAKQTASSFEGSPDDATLEATMPGRVLGTVGYMAPEQVRGREAGLRSDVFALGVLLYELLSGERAFSESSAVETLSAILHQVPSYRTLPREMAPIVERCLAKDPQERFASAAELHRAVTAIGSLGASSVSMAAVSHANAVEASAKAVAVLPFANLSSDPDTEYFSDGVTDEIINVLAQIRGLRVAARTSSFYFKGSTEDLETIGEKLQVSKLVEGSVRRAGNRVRITAQLVNVADGYQLWSQRFDRQMDDIFAIQDEIAAAIADRLRVSLSGAREGAVAARAKVDPAAYEELLRGRFLFEQRTLSQALRCYEQAREIDPDYAPIHAAIAQTQVFEGLLGRRPPSEVMPSALRSAERALELDSSEGTPHTAIGLAKWLYEWDGAAAEAAFERALEKGAKAADAHTLFAFFLGSALGRHEEAVEHTKRALELDPMSDFVCTYHGMVLYIAHRYEEAIAFLEPFLARASDVYGGWRMLGLSYLATERFDAAESSFERALELSNRHTFCVVEMALTRLGQGRRREALAFQAEAVEKVRSYGTPAGYLAAVPHKLGDFETARGFLQGGCRRSRCCHRGLQPLAVVATTAPRPGLRRLVRGDEPGTAACDGR